MTTRTGLRLRRLTWQVVLASLAFLQIVATFFGLQERLYLAKWGAGSALIVCFFILGRYKLSSALAIEFGLLTTLIGIGFISQLADNIDRRAIELGTSYSMTATAAFLVAPATFRRRSVRTLVWPPFLFGVAVGTFLGMYLGLLNPAASLTVHEGRIRFFGLFSTPNSAGAAGLIGMVLAGAASRFSNRWSYLLFVPPFALVMALADSRGSILAGAVFVVAWLVAGLARLPRQRAVLLCSLGMAVILGMSIYYAWSHDLGSSQLSPTALNQFSSGRWRNWSRSLSYLDSPYRLLFGLGLSRNFSFMPDVAVGSVAVRGSNADNIYIDLLGRTGITGLGLFLAAVGMVVVRLMNGLRKRLPVSGPECALSLAAVMATLALGLTESGILTWGWVHAMVVWPLSASTVVRVKQSAAPTALR